MEQYPQSTLMYRRVLPKTEAIDESVQLSNPALIARGSHTVPLRGGGGGGQGGKLPRAPRQKGGPAIPKKKFVRQFFNSDCQCKSFSCFMLTRFSRNIAK